MTPLTANITKSTEKIVSKVRIIFGGKIQNFDFYKNFTEMGFTDNEGKPGNFAEQYNMRRETHLTSLQQKEEEMRQKFVIRVKEKEAELKEAEKEVH